MVMGSLPEIVEAMRWSDASSAWVMLGISLLFHLYTRYITESQRVNRTFVGLFTVLYLACVLIACVHNAKDFPTSPLLPTFIFSVVWFFQFLEAVKRFWTRSCCRCGVRMEISVPDSYAAQLSQKTNMITTDLWFCPQCRCTSSSAGIIRQCSTCDHGNLQVVAMYMIEPPTHESFGTLRTVSECSGCRSRYSHRALVSPVGIGSDKEERERRAISCLDRVQINQVRRC